MATSTPRAPARRAPRKSSRRRHGVLAAVFALILVLAVVWLLHVHLLRAVADGLVHADAPVHADLIVVLAGDWTGHRILKAGELIREGYAPKALVSSPAAYYEVTEAQLAIPLAVRHGYPASYFFELPNTGHSTEEEARVIIAELRRRRLHRIDIVTSDFHTSRAGHIYRKLAPDLEFHLVAAPYPYFHPGGWWRDREDRKTVFYEWLKNITGRAGI